MFNTHETSFLTQ